MSLDNDAIDASSAPLADESLQSAPAGSAAQSVTPPAPSGTAAQPAASAPAPGEPPQTQDPDAQPQEPPKPKGTQSRINELTRQRYEAQREAEALRQQLQQVQARAQQQLAADPAPKIENFTDLNQFLEARDAWNRKQAQAEWAQSSQEAAQRQQLEQRHHQQQVAVQQTVERFVANEAEAVSRYADYQQTASSPLLAQLREARPDITQAVIDSEHGPDIVYFLGKNPQQVQKIASLSPFAAAREIGRIEQMFMGQKNQTTNAPPPPRTVGGRAEATRSVENMSLKEYRAYRSKQT